MSKPLNPDSKTQAASRLGGALALLAERGSQPRAPRKPRRAIFNSTSVFLLNSFHRRFFPDPPKHRVRAGGLQDFGSKPAFVGPLPSAGEVLKEPHPS